MAQDMADEGRLHASLANLESLPSTLPEVRLRKARVLRLLGSNEAEPLYKSLLGTCRAAEGEHGLGQLSAARGDNGQALMHLQAAVKLSPTDEKIRNDLGVVYLNQLKLEQARFQFLTAIELKQSDTLAALNMVTLLIYQDDWTQAAELVSRTGLTPDQVNDAQARAEKLKNASGGSPLQADKVAAVADPAVIAGRQP
jgi:Flp pilus assembly protein TadD